MENTKQKVPTFWVFYDQLTKEQEPAFKKSICEATAVGEHAFFHWKRTRKIPAKKRQLICKELNLPESILFPEEAEVNHSLSV